MKRSTIYNPEVFSFTPCHMQAFGENIWPVPCPAPGDTGQCAGCLVGDELLDVEFRDNEAWVWHSRDWTKARYAEVLRSQNSGKVNRIVDEDI